jgi:hypothetical protein
MIPAVMLGLPVVLTSFMAIRKAVNENREAKKALTEADSLYKQNNLLASFIALQKVNKHDREHPLFEKLDTVISSKTTIKTDPPGVKVFYRIYHTDSLSWYYLGKTPLESIKVPKEASADILMVKRGYDTVIGQHWFPERYRISWPNNVFYRRLFPKGTVPDGMVHVVEKIRDTTFSFFIDKFEVTNKEYKKFIDQGGYRKQEYWKYPFVKGDDTLSWAQAMDRFRDEFHFPGPHSWKRGNFPKDQDENYPVGGVSWYEAAAYAAYAGKELPARRHWLIAYWGCQYEIANLNNVGPVPVGTLSRFNNYGALDMAGNVREWCFNGNSHGMKLIAGGSWSDHVDIVWDPITILSPWDRSEQNGFRCVIYLDKDSLPENDFREQDIEYKPPVNVDTLKIPTEEEFRDLKRFYDYDNKPLESTCLERDFSHPDWIFEKVEFSTPTTGGRMIAFIWLPKQAVPPYQVIIHSTSIQPFEEGSSENWLETITPFIGNFIRAGRAWITPMVDLTWERRWVKAPSNYAEGLIRTKNVVIDFRRTMDYLESRPDTFNQDGFCIYSHQWGCGLAAYAAAVDDRLDAIIFDRGGLWVTRGIPQARMTNFVPYIKVPSFVFADLYDPYYPFDTWMDPLYKLLGTPDDKKELYRYVGIYDMQSELYSTIRSFLDRHLGEVRKK